MAALLGQVDLVALKRWSLYRGGRNNLLRYKPTAYPFDYHEVASFPFLNSDDLVGADLEVLGDLEYHGVAFFG